MKMSKLIDVVPEELRAGTIIDFDVSTDGYGSPYCCFNIKYSRKETDAEYKERKN